MPPSEASLPEKERNAAAAERDAWPPGLPPHATAALAKSAPEAVQSLLASLPPPPDDASLLHLRMVRSDHGYVVLAIQTDRPAVVSIGHLGAALSFFLDA